MAIPAQTGTMATHRAVENMILTILPLLSSVVPVEEEVVNLSYVLLLELKNCDNFRHRRRRDLSNLPPATTGYRRLSP